MEVWICRVAMVRVAMADSFLGSSVHPVKWVAVFSTRAPFPSMSCIRDVYEDNDVEPRLTCGFVYVYTLLSSLPMPFEGVPADFASLLQTFFNFMTRPCQDICFLPFSYVCALSTGFCADHMFRESPGLKTCQDFKSIPSKQ